MSQPPSGASLLLPPSITLASPSSAHGIPRDAELRHRVYGCELIQEGSVLLKLPQVCAATGQVLLQRFYYRVSLRDFDAFHVAMAALFLASKIEEEPRRLSVRERERER